MLIMLLPARFLSLLSLYITSSFSSISASSPPDYPTLVQQQVFVPGVSAVGVSSLTFIDPSRSSVPPSLSSSLDYTLLFAHQIPINAFIPLNNTQQPYNSTQSNTLGVLIVNMSTSTNTTRVTNSSTLIIVSSHSSSWSLLAATLAAKGWTTVISVISTHRPHTAVLDVMTTLQQLEAEQQQRLSPLYQSSSSIILMMMGIDCSVGVRVIQLFSSFLFQGLLCLSPWSGLFSSPFPSMSSAASLPVSTSVLLLTPSSLCPSVSLLSVFNSVSSSSLPVDGSRCRTVVTLNSTLSCLFDDSALETQLQQNDSQSTMQEAEQALSAATVCQEESSCREQMKLRASLSQSASSAPLLSPIQHRVLLTSILIPWLSYASVGNVSAWLEFDSLLHSIPLDFVQSCLVNQMLFNQ